LPFRGAKIEMVAKINSPRVEIHYCTQCRFILRANWIAQELLMTFADDLGELALVPATGGVFTVLLDSEEVFSRKEQGRFPESKELKQLIRDRINPEMELGHSDNKSK
jgi:selenoprotein W-related protein